MLRGLLSESETIAGYELVKTGDGLFAGRGLRLALVTILLSSLLRPSTPSVAVARHDRQRSFDGLGSGLFRERKLASVPPSESPRVRDVAGYPLGSRSSHFTLAPPFAANVRRNMDPNDQRRARPGIHRRANDDFQTPEIKSTVNIPPDRSGSTNLQDMLLDDPWFNDDNYRDPDPTINVNDYAFFVALRIDEEDDQDGEVLPFPVYRKL